MPESKHPAHYVSVMLSEGARPSRSTPRTLTPPAPPTGIPIADPRRATALVATAAPVRQQLRPDNTYGSGRPRSQVAAVVAGRVTFLTPSRSLLRLISEVAKNPTWYRKAMIERWVAASFLATEKNFRRIMGWKDLWQLKATLGRQTSATKQEVA